VIRVRRIRVTLIEFIIVIMSLAFSCQLGIG